MILVRAVHIRDVYKTYVPLLCVAPQPLNGSLATKHTLSCDANVNMYTQLQAFGSCVIS